MASRIRFFWFFFSFIFLGQRKQARRYPCRLPSADMHVTKRRLSPSPNPKSMSVAVLCKVFVWAASPVCERRSSWQSERSVAFRRARACVSLWPLCVAGDTVSLLEPASWIIVIIRREPERPRRLWGGIQRWQYGDWWMWQSPLRRRMRREKRRRMIRKRKRRSMEEGWEFRLGRRCKMYRFINTFL